MSQFPVSGNKNMWGSNFNTCLVPNGFTLFENDFVFVFQPISDFFYWSNDCSSQIICWIDYKKGKMISKVYLNEKKY